ncbi:hypothetical protein ACJJWD_07005 [Comamonas testosteroni]|uniref:hypothetical protein n=1 Tax=Comamonas testosteroni TaxID=285 RepID=UPI00389A612D
MNKVSKLKRYTDMFRRHLSGYLAPGINIGTVIYPVEQEGAVFEFHLQKNLDMSERVERTNPSIASVLKRIPQNFIGVLSRVFVLVERILVLMGTEFSSLKVKTLQPSGMILQ